MKLKEKNNIPYVVAVRNTDVNVFFKKMPHLRSLGLKIMLESKAVVFLSQSYRDTVIEEYVPEKFKKDIYIKSEIIPNGIDDYWFKNLNVKKNIIEKNTFKILYVGDININKNLTTTTQALKVLKDQGYNIEFTIVGKVKNNKVYKKIKDLSFVNYISPQPKEELLKIYKNNDIFVMPSIKETFGLVYAEAMSQGLPVIYSKKQGFDKQFDNGLIGFAVDCYNHIEISEKIKEIYSNYKFYSTNCNDVVEKFKWDDISHKYAALYSKS